MRELIKWLVIVALVCGIQTLKAESTELSIACSWGEISATLAQPEGGSDTVVVIIAGSGPTDRDGNSMAAGLRPYSYSMLSDALVSEGFAVLRYDKRAIGRSPIPAQDVPNLVFEDYVDDLEQIASNMRQRGFERVVLAGHSEGALVALIAAERRRVEIDGVVTLCAAGYSIDSILLAQLGAQLMPANIVLMYQAEQIIKRLKRGEPVSEEQIPKELLSLFHPVVQPFLISEMQYDPQQLIAGCEQPILIISGGRDIQVSVDNAEVLAKSQPKAQSRMFEHMSHVLKDSEASDRMGQLTSVYSHSNYPLTSGLAEAIAEFINNTK
jgi:pimeloyl-ACP methyl ester carboxylesterase